MEEKLKKFFVYGGIPGSISVPTVILLACLRDGFTDFSIKALAISSLFSIIYIPFAILAIKKEGWKWFW